MQWDKKKVLILKPGIKGKFVLFIYRKSEGLVIADTRSYDQLSIDEGSIFSHAEPHNYLLAECVSAAHHGLPEPVLVLLFSYPGTGGMSHGTG
jgi:hypothetical protein